MTKNIRNFSIIAHIDHGKSTLADRLLEYTGVVAPHQVKEQILDNMDLERERGITIKSHPVRLIYQEYVLNLIDTPGHVDFTYEVSRSLAAGEGALLLVDATQGVEAQTLAHTQLALKNNLIVIPVINKIDLANADVEGVSDQIKDIFSFKEKIILASAKKGIGTKEILGTIVEKIPPPQGSSPAPLQALIFDSFFNPYRGVIVYIKVVNGTLKPGMRIKVFSTKRVFEVEEVGIFQLKMVPVKELSAGEIGYLIAKIKRVEDTKIGDTIVSAEERSPKPLSGYKEAKPVVFSAFYPVKNDDYKALQGALEKLSLNDASFTFAPESSSNLGFGFRGGFLGMLHMEIIQARLEREYNLDLIATTPNVIYRVTYEGGKIVEIKNPTELSFSAKITQMEEPYVKIVILSPGDYVGVIMKLVQNKRGIFKDMSYLSERQTVLTYELPLSEMMVDFADKLKSVSRGYASFDYEHIGYKVSDLVKLNILVNEEIVDDLSLILSKDKAYTQGRALIQKLKEVFPRQQFAFPVQAAIGHKIIARETVKAFRKDVTSKLYGGDITRKRKLLEKQKEGKKRIKKFGKVEIPQEAFMAIKSVDFS